MNINFSSGLSHYFSKLNCKRDICILLHNSLCMEYIHVKKIGDKKYYSLMISVRKCGRVITKDMCNLGSNFSKISIRDLEKNTKKR